MKSYKNPDAVSLGYPRSGNNWLRFIVEYLTNYSTGMGIMNRPNRRPLHNLTNILDSNNKNKLIVGGHFIKDTFNGNRKLLFVLRNYKECLISHAIGDEDLHNGFIKDDVFTSLINPQIRNGRWDKTTFLHYLDLLNFFDNYKGEKEIIYYEDIVNKKVIEETLQRLVLFLDGNKEKIQLFIQRFDDYAKESKLIYAPIKRKEKVSNPNCLSLTQRKVLDNIIKDSYSHLEKYTKKYYDKI